jgi:TolB-like protein
MSKLQTTRAPVIITDPPFVPRLDTQLDDAKRSKKSKVRSAWIAFVGRILAQVVGATAAVVLAVMVLQSQANPARSADEAAPPLVTAPVTVGVDRVRRSPGEASVAVLPLDNFSGDSRNDAVASALTEALTAALSNEAGVRVLSRTSSVYYGGQRQPLTELARRMDVDWVVEWALISEGGRSRVIVQLIDAPADEHAWAATYDRPAADALSLQTSLAPPIARDIARILTAKQSREAGTERMTDAPAVPAASAGFVRR